MSRPIDRRDFLKHTAAVTVGATVVGSALGGTQDDPKNPRIVDTHQHLWDLNRFNLPWIQKTSPLARSYVMQDYLQATNGLNVVKAVYMEVDVDPKQQVAEAEYILDVCRQGKTPTVGAVISGRPASAEFRAYLQRFKGNRHLKGVRQVLHGGATPAGYCLAADFQRGLRVLDEMGLSYDLCMRHGELPDALKLVETLPNLRFILDHCGNPDLQAKDNTAWRRNIERLAQCKNLVCKVSGIVAGAREMDGRRPRPVRQPRARIVRPQPRDVRRRLARVYDAGDLSAVGRGAAQHRPQSLGGEPAQAIPRQRGRVLWAQVTVS